jgi:hypothetical protein
MISFSPKSPSYRKLKEAFEKDWSNHRAALLTADCIKYYNKVRKKPVKQKPYAKGQLAKILGTKPHHEAGTVEEESTGIWRDCTSILASKKAERIVGEETNWEAKRYEIICEDGPHPYRIGDYIFWFDFKSKKLSLVQVKDTTRTSIPTPDGRYFIAVKKVRNYSRRFSTKLWEHLKEMDISKTKAKVRRKINIATSKQLKYFLRNS